MWCRSPLQTACGGLELDISRFLVSRGASLEHVDVFGQNVAHHVVSGFNWRLNVPKLQCLFVKFLLSNSFFDFDALDCIHRSPLHHAADCSTVDVTQLLLKYGADSHARDINGQTALHRAATVGNSALVWFLLDCGSDVSSQNDEGDTPLRFAACMGELAVCTMLLECGADVSAKDLAGVTPLHGAATFDFSQDLFMVLFEHGADPHKVGCLSYDNGRTLYLFEGMETPADIARRDGPSITASYVKILHDFYPEIIVDEEGDVFWNTQEDGVPGYGCSYDSVELIEIIEARREEAWLNGGRSH